MYVRRSRSFAAFTAPPDVRRELQLVANLLESKDRFPANFVNGVIYLKLDLAARRKVSLPMRIGNARVLRVNVL